MWKDAYLIGVNQIDQQHKQLIGSLNDLLVCVQRTPDTMTDQCRQTIDFLKSYSVNHFAAEEMFQESIRFPHIEEHREMHRSFADTLHELELKLIRTDYNPTTIHEVTHLLTQWWLFHIIKEDRRMADYLPAQ